MGERLESEFNSDVLIKISLIGIVLFLAFSLIFCYSRSMKIKELSMKTREMEQSINALAKREQNSQERNPFSEALEVNRKKMRSDFEQAKEEFERNWNEKNDEFNEKWNEQMNRFKRKWEEQ